MKRCKTCKELNVRERNGVAVSKYCVECRKAKELQLREKNKLKKEQIKADKLAKEERKKQRKLASKKYQESRFRSLHKKAWKKTSDEVRQKGADEFGYNLCYTCDVRLHWKELQCGHFHHGKLDFDLRNLKPQCPQCNTYKNGNLAVYATKLCKELGVDGLEQLRLDANTTTYTIEDLEKIIEKYTKLSINERIRKDFGDVLTELAND